MPAAVFKHKCIWFCIIICNYMFALLALCPFTMPIKKQSDCKQSGSRAMPSTAFRSTLGILHLILIAFYTNVVLCQVYEWEPFPLMTYSTYSAFNRNKWLLVLLAQLNSHEWMENIHVTFQVFIVHLSNIVWKLLLFHQLFFAPPFSLAPSVFHTFFFKWIFIHLRNYSSFRTLISFLFFLF